MDDVWNHQSRGPSGPLPRGAERTGEGWGRACSGAAVAVRGLGGGDSATRRPWFWLRLSGCLWFRYAERHLSAVFLKLPPRMTRVSPRGARPLVVVTAEARVAGEA
jgi:hypothetical protein